MVYLLKMVILHSFLVCLPEGKFQNLCKSECIALTFFSVVAGMMIGTGFVIRTWPCFSYFQGCGLV